MALNWTEMNCWLLFSGFAYAILFLLNEILFPFLLLPHLLKLYFKIQLCVTFFCEDNPFFPNTGSWTADPLSTPLSWINTWLYILPVTYVTWSSSNNNSFCLLIPTRFQEHNLISLISFSELPCCRTKVVVSILLRKKLKLSMVE